MKKLQILSRIKDFEEFVNRTDIEIISLDVRGCEQSFMFQENFIAVIYYKLLTLNP